MLGVVAGWWAAGAGRAMLVGGVARRWLWLRGCAVRDVRASRLVVVVLVVLACARYSKKKQEMRRSSGTTTPTSTIVKVLRY